MLCATPLATLLSVYALLLLRGAEGITEAGGANVYLSTLGIPTDLPELRVDYSSAADTMGLEVHGAASHFTRSSDRWLAQPPSIKWQEHVCSGYCTVVMLSPDVPAANSDLSKPGAAGPRLHALWKDCNFDQITNWGSVADQCNTVAYSGPEPYLPGDHRYIFVLFQQDGSVAVPSTGRNQWDFAGFLSANPKLEPAAVNYFTCSP